MYCPVNDKEVRVILARHLSYFRDIDILHIAFAAEPRAVFVINAVFRANPAAIEPEDVDITIVMCQFFNLVKGEVAETLPSFRIFLRVIIDVSVRGSPLSRPIVIMMPIRLREIEACPEPIVSE